MILHSPRYKRYGINIEYSKIVLNLYFENEIISALCIRTIPKESIINPNMCKYKRVPVIYMIRFTMLIISQIPPDPVKRSSRGEQKVDLINKLKMMLKVGITDNATKM